MPKLTRPPLSVAAQIWGRDLGCEALDADLETKTVCAVI